MFFSKKFVFHILQHAVPINENCFCMLMYSSFPSPTLASFTFDMPARLKMLLLKHLVLNWKDE